MKIQVALPSGTLKEYAFKKTVDTSLPDSDQPASETLISNKESPPKTRSISFLKTDKDNHNFYVTASGSVYKDLTLLGNIGTTCAGLSIYSSPTSDTFALVVGVDGKLHVFSKNLKAEYDFGFPVSAACGNLETPLEITVANAEKYPNFSTYKIELDLSDELEITAEIVNETSISEDTLPSFHISSIFSSKNTVVYGTSTGLLRVFENNEQVSETKVGTHGVTVIEVDNGNLFVGDAYNHVFRYQINPLKMLGSYKGILGAPKSFSVRGNYLAVGSLDKYIRVYDLEKRSLNGKVYVGEHALAVKLISHDEEEGDDDLWDKIKPAKKRKVETKAEKVSHEISSEEEDEESFGEESEESEEEDEEDSYEGESEDESESE